MMGTQYFFWYAGTKIGNLGKMGVTSVITMTQKYFQPVPSWEVKFSTSAYFGEIYVTLI